MEIRRAKRSDARGIHEMHMRSIRTNCGSHYSDPEIKAWAGRAYNEAHRLRDVQNDYVLVLVEGDEILGYAHLSNDGELRALYLDATVIGRGFGPEMLALVEEEARIRGLSRIFLDSTLNAVDFYSHCGFTFTGDQHTIEINGQRIRSVPMEKILRS